MNILVLSEKFCKGGLETHINTYYENLKENHNFVFCFGNYTKTEYLKDAKVIEGINLSWNITIQDFCETVNRLINIIKDNNIDVIHAHPFYSIFPAVFAANATNTKLVYTYHGYASINFTNSAIETILFQFFIEQFISKIFCVSKNAIPWFNKFEKQQAYYIPNIIDEKYFREHNPELNKSWALISRLDNDKYTEISKFLNMLPKLDIKKLDIYGSGNKEEELKTLVEKLNLTKKVRFKGYVENINDSLNKYTGTIGLGRVSLESLCMNYPSILAGYGKVIGLIDKEIYEKVKDLNFVPSELNDINFEELNKQIKEINKGHYKRFQLREKVINDFGLKNINKYVSEIKNAPKLTLNILNNLYEDIKGIINHEQSFYNSEEIFKLLQKHIAYYTKNNNLKSLINIYNEIYSTKNFYADKSIEIQNQIDSHIASLENKYNSQLELLSNKYSKEIKELSNKHIQYIEELSSNYNEEIKKLQKQNEELSYWVYRIDNKPNIIKRIFKKIKKLFIK